MVALWRLEEWAAASGGYLVTANSQMTDAHNGVLGPDDRKAWDRDAIPAWAATTKGLAATEAGVVIAAGVVTVATWWFDWAKGVQGLPYPGGAGRPEPTRRPSADG